jgi:hypothetical protein
MAIASVILVISLFYGSILPEFIAWRNIRAKKKRPRGLRHALRRKCRAVRIQNGAGLRLGRNAASPTSRNLPALPLLLASHKGYCVNKRGNYGEHNCIIQENISVCILVQFLKKARNKHDTKHQNQ